MGISLLDVRSRYVRYRSMTFALSDIDVWVTFAAICQTNKPKQPVMSPMRAVTFRITLGAASIVERSEVLQQPNQSSLTNDVGHATLKKHCIVFAMCLWLET